MLLDDVFPMERKSHVLFVGWYPYGEETPGAKYVLGLGKALRAQGHQVSFAPGLPSKSPPSNNVTSFAGFTYFLGPSAPHPGKTSSFLAKYLGFRDKTLRWLYREAPKDITHIFTYSGSCVFLSRLKRYCELRKITLVNIIVEWYDIRHYTYSRPQEWLIAVDGEVQRYWINRGIRKAVCISKYLESYYSKSGCETLRVPPLIDFEVLSAHSNAHPRTDNNARKFVFLGSCRWNRQDLVLQAMKGMLQRNRSLELHYIGATKEELQEADGTNGKLLASLGKSIVIRGRIPGGDVPRILPQFDFGILFRNSERWANAGFPTKVPEFLAAGVPVITNLTSDLGSYLVAEKNSLLVNELNAPSITDAFERALQFSRTERLQLRTNSLISAKENFDYHNYSLALSRFLGCKDVSA